MLQRNPIKKRGKKAKEWHKAKSHLLALLKASGEYNIIGRRVFGLCQDCKKYKELTPDHKIKRSQGGTHDPDNIDWVCLGCHRLRDQMGDPKNKKPASKKATWMKPHPCKHCKKATNLLLCNHCGRVSA